MHRWIHCMWGIALVLLAWSGMAGAQPSGPSSSAAPAPPPTEAPPAAPATPPAAPPGDAPPEPVETPTASPQRSGGTHLPAGANVAVIPVEGMIYDFTLQSLERRTQKALNNGATMIVIELDTPGGVLTSALDISTFIKKLPVPTAAWINDRAYSAGILIASSAQQIVMSSAAATGDCAPVVPGQNLSPTERAKALSPLLSEFADSAVRNGYPYPLFHAMCVLGQPVYLIENPAAGQQMLVLEPDYQFLVKGEDPPSVATLPTDQQVGAPEQTVADPTEKGQWQLVRQVHSGSTLLTVNQDEAVDLGLAAAKGVDTLAQLQAHLGATSVVRVSQTWSEGLVAWLVHPMVRGVLVVGLLLGGYMELQSPGLGLPGLLAVSCLLVLLGAPFLVGLAEVWHLLLFLVGLVLLVTELMFFVGFGLLGIAGLVMMAAGLVLSVVPTSGSGPVPLPAPAMWGLVQESLVWLMVSLVVSVGGFIAITRHMGQLPWMRRMVLAGGAGAVAEGYQGEPTHVSGDDTVGARRVAVGDRGISLTELRPVGRVEINDQVIDAQSVGGWIDSHQPVQVIEVRGNVVVVDTAQA